MTNFERIYLEPDHDQIEGRMWCQDDDPASLGEPWTEYVRADLYAALLEIVREAATFPCRAPDPPCREVYPDTPEHRCMTCRAWVALEKGGEG